MIRRAWDYGSIRPICLHEFFARDAGLFQDADERSGFQLSMIRHHASDRAAPHHDVAAALSGDDKAQ
jgi:hypothetical protein